MAAAERDEDDEPDFDPAYLEIGSLIPQRFRSRRWTMPQTMKQVGRLVPQDFPASRFEVLEMNPIAALSHFAKSKRGDRDIVHVKRILRDLSVRTDLLSLLNENLIYACEAGNVLIVQELVERGANIRWRGGEPISVACFNGHLDVIRYLFERFDEVDAMGFAEDSLSYAAHSGNIELMRFLQVAMDGEVPDVIHIGMLRGDLDLVKWMVDVLHVEAIDEGIVSTTLFNGHHEIVEYLIERGMIPEDILLDNNGHNLLTFCASNGWDKLVRYLIENGADAGQQEDAPLKSAIFNGHVKVVKYLAEDAQREMFEEHLEQWRMTAVQAGQFKVAQYITRLGIMWGGFDDDGNVIWGG
jgi:hypothetical protein